MATSTDRPIRLGPRGPFPDAPQQRVLERRWLHYAFLSRDNTLGMVANISWLGPDAARPDEQPHSMAILLLHLRGEGWRASQFNARPSQPPWSAFRLPHTFHTPQQFDLVGVAGSPAVRLQLRRTSRPCTSQCAPFAGDQYLRWQSETGVVGRGDWAFDQQLLRDVEALGYHERVRGHWGWPQMGGWVFGFANDPGGTTHTPPTAVVFTLIQPPDPPGAATGSVMLWRDGRLRRHFPRRNVEVAVRGQLDRDRVYQVPDLANLFGVAPMAPIPRRLLITARLGRDWAVLDFLCESAARIVIPNELGLQPYSVHEVIGPCRIEGRCSEVDFAFETYGIVEFAGGASGDR